MNRFLAGLIKVALTVLFYVMYWELLAVVFDAWFPINPTTKILSMIMMVLLVPLSVVTTHLTGKAFK